MDRREFLYWGAKLSLLSWLGCGREVGPLLPARESDPLDAGGLTLLTRFAHVTDTHLVDEESPARFPGAQIFTGSAWRPHEAYSTQLLDGIIRTANRVHAAGRTVDFLLHTGDACDNVQSNELGWALDILSGRAVDPLTGPDDRPAATRPAPDLDPHAPFVPQGLYQQGVHGAAPSIPWYALLGNHDVYGIGNFPIFQDADGVRRARLPLDGRPGVLLPTRLDPTGATAYGHVTPAHPSPPPFLEHPGPIEPNSTRAYFDKSEFARALFGTAGAPGGHGFADAAAWGMWYSTSPVPGLRLIGLDTTDAVTKVSGAFYDEGSLSRRQLDYLHAELDAATARDEVVVVATHHPSAALAADRGSEVLGDEFRSVLNSYAQVVLHVCGHRHRNRVCDRGGYLEIETCSTLDLPQEGRLIELWRDPADARILIAYEMFSHIDESLPPLGDDPLRALRAQAQAIARGDKDAGTRQLRFDPSGASPAGGAADRAARVLLPGR